jgi:hypothetical protein
MSFIFYFSFHTLFWFKTDCYRIKITRNFRDGQVAYSDKKVYKIFVVKAAGKRPLEKPKCRQDDDDDDNNKSLAEDRDQC